MVILWNELRDARERRNLTQEELADQLGVSTRTITNWERVGVARKAEYKVYRFFGDDLLSDQKDRDVFADMDFDKRIRELSLSERADHEGTTEFALALKDASDAELLEELQRRARKRGLAVISAEVSTPSFMQREVSQILRGERRRLKTSDFGKGTGLEGAAEPAREVTPNEVTVGGSGENGDVGIPENVEELWGLAAHPKTEAPEDHTP